MDGGKIDKLTKINRNNGSQIHAAYVYMGELMMDTDIWQCFKLNPRNLLQYQPESTKIRKCDHQS
jgi:hypothetical protein